MMNTDTKNTIVGNLASFTAYFIFGFNIVCCKNIANDGHISPMELFCLRSVGALILFWIADAIFGKKEKVTGSDMWKIALASFLGLFLTQFAFLVAITMTTAVDAAVLNLLSPVMAMIVASVALKDKISVNGVFGLAISLAGVLFIVLNTITGGGGATHTSLGGVLLMLVNVASFASYIGIFKPLIQRYSVLTFMKWMFVFSTLYALPFSGGVFSVEFSEIPLSVIWQILFVIVGATFVAYFMIPIGQKYLKPMLVCMYAYVQPVIAMGVSLYVGLDTMSWAKGIATFFIFIGVGIVNFSPGKSKKECLK